LCLIKHELMIHPVTTDDGRTIDFTSLVHYICTSNKPQIRSLVTREALSLHFDNRLLTLLVDKALKLAISKMNSNDIFTHFKTAVKNKELQNFKNLLEQIWDNYAQIFGAAPLGLLPLCAMHGFIPGIEYLLSKNFTINEKSNYGSKTALYFAIVGNQLDTIQYLLKKGANIYCQGIKGETALHDCAQHGNVEIWQALVTFTKDDINRKFSTEEAPKKIMETVNVRDANGCNPANIAVKNKHLALVQALHADSVDFHYQDLIEQQTVLHDAVNNDDIPMLEFLLKYFSCYTETPSAQGFTPLQLTAMQGKVVAAQLLLEKGAELHPKTGNTTPLLLIAILNNKPDFIDLLLQKGISIHQVFQQNKTALHHAAYLNYEHLVHKFIALGIDTEHKDIFQATALESIEYKIAQLQGGQAYNAKERYKRIINILKAKVPKVLPQAPLLLSHFNANRAQNTPPVLGHDATVSANNNDAEAVASALTHLQMG